MPQSERGPAGSETAPPASVDVAQVPASAGSRPLEQHASNAATAPVEASDLLQVEAPAAEFSFAGTDSTDRMPRASVSSRPAGDGRESSAADPGDDDERAEDRAGNAAPIDEAASDEADPITEPVSAATLPPILAEAPVGPPPDEEGIGQFLTIEQTASISVSGYAGTVITRMRFDQDVSQTQIAYLDFNPHAGGYFFVKVDQLLTIEEDTLIDIDIFDEGDTVYIDFLMRDNVDVEQETSVTVSGTAGAEHGGGSVEVRQDLQTSQAAEIDIDIEDELEERYAINVLVSFVQQLETDQDLDLAITQDSTGHTDVTFDADQVVAIDHEAVVRIDFALA
jgi:hypothetical protein